MSKHHFQFGLQTRFELSTLGLPVNLKFIVRTIYGQFLEFGRIIPHKHVPLLQPQELYLLPFQVSGKVFWEKLSLEGILGDSLFFGLHLPPSILRPVFGFLYWHRGCISHLMGITTIHSPKYSFQVLDPLICSIRGESALELAGITPTEFIQALVFFLSLWCQRVLSRTRHRILIQVL
ncbi:hypothetical protein Lalb_Chr20g0115491 [Lupinus albus]|uniref:Uncharacterized protein n=1 Tax=Lupinus albus TaxID=3870 RepID=A0A6A4NGG3_LUPAL|nr:hypothetical protein Lalb_Chr20g0115491 [Lupinus albus]